MLTFSNNIFRLVVVFSIERLVAVYFPMKLTAIFTPRIKKMSIIMVFVVGLALYFFNLKTTGLIKSNSSYQCAPIDDWMIFTKYMTLVKNYFNVPKKTFFRNFLQASKMNYFFFKIKDRYICHYAYSCCFNLVS